jgi:DNA recombination protein RmuC
MSAELVLLVIATAGAGVAALFAILCFLRTQQLPDALTPQSATQILRAETDIVRAAVEDQARGLRQELGQSLKGFQELTHVAFGTLRDGINAQVRGFGERLDHGVKSTTESVTAISTKLAHDMEEMRAEASIGRENLRGLVEQKLEQNIAQQCDSARILREELGGNFGTLRDGINAQVRGFGERLDHGVKSTTESVTAISTKLTHDMEEMRAEASIGRENLRGLVEQKLEQNIAQQCDSARILREELGGNFEHLGIRVKESLAETGRIQIERLANVTTALSVLTEKSEKAQESLRLTVEGRLDAIRQDNATRLDEMRQTVDEKLQGTLEQRLGASFKLGSEQLEQVFRGIGEMQSLATGVGDLKKMLSNVKMRGAWGEVSLGSLLDQVLTVDQYERNVEVKPGSNQRVEYAIKLPGGDDGDGDRGCRFHRSPGNNISAERGDHGHMTADQLVGKHWQIFEVPLGPPGGSAASFAQHVMAYREGLRLATRPFLTQRDCAAFIKTNDMERVLADIDADYGNRSVEILRHGVLLVFGAPCQLRSLAGQEHGRTIPLAEMNARPSTQSNFNYACC